MRKQSLSFLLILAGFMAFSSIATDIYLSAMPSIQNELGGNVELTITGFLVGFALAQLVWGPISDRFGRRIPLAIGTILFILGSLGCALAPSMGLLVVFRAVQAIGACTGPMLSRAIVRDLYSGEAAARMFSTLMIIMAVAPIIGPLFGSWILTVGTWRLIFYVVTAIAVVLLVSLCLLPETLPATKRSPLSMGHTLRTYIRLLGQRTFIIYTLCVTFFYIAAYAFITGSSLVYINYFKITAQFYSILFAVNIVGITLLGFANRVLVSRFSLRTLLRMSTAFAAVFCVVLLVFGLTGWGGLAGIAIPYFFVVSMNGIIAASASAAALSSVDPTSGGSASALQSSMQYGSGIVSSALLAAFSTSTPTAMLVIIAVFVFLSALMAFIAPPVAIAE